MQQKEISVIVPIYNGQNHLKKCILSVLHQVKIDINLLELILIDDGSVDNSLNIAKNFAQKHQNIIQVISQENQGVAKTRNLGISIASGKYIMFLDQDDFYDSNYCFTMLGVIKNSNFLVVSSGVRRIDENNKVIKKSKLKDCEYYKYKNLTAWSGIHNTEFLRSSKIEFFENEIGEDTVFALKEIIKAGKYYKKIDFIGYNWFYNTKSVSSTTQKEIKENQQKAIYLLIQKMCKVIKDSGRGAFDKEKLEKMNKKYQKYFLVKTLIFYLLRACSKTEKSIFLATQRECFALIKKEFPDIFKSLFFIVGPKQEQIAVRISVGAMILLNNFGLFPLFSKLFCRKDLVI